MATQFHFAHSSEVFGAGVFAGGMLYHLPLLSYRRYKSKTDIRYFKFFFSIYYFFV